MTDETPPAAAPPKKSDLSALGCFGIGCGIPLALGLIFVVILVISGMNASPSSNNDAEARIACENSIKNRLKSPSSAEFDTSVDGSGAGPYTVSGTVDSDNSFGASIRGQFQCTVTIDSGNTRTIVDYLD